MTDKANTLAIHGKKKIKKLSIKEGGDNQAAKA
jgi:hypothetical protein